VGDDAFARDAVAAGGKEPAAVCHDGGHHGHEEACVEFHFVSAEPAPPLSFLFTHVAKLREDLVEQLLDLFRRGRIEEFFCGKQPGDSGVVSLQAVIQVGDQLTHDVILVDRRRKTAFPGGGKQLHRFDKRRHQCFAKEMTFAGEMAEYHRH
jgi:hypothetical protein